MKVWFDKKKGDLMIEDETGRVTCDIYGVPLSDVVFEIETTPRGAIRCVAIGNIIAIPPARGADVARQRIIREARSSMDFYWSRDKQWPFAGARLALISKAQGGFATSRAETGGRSALIFEEPAESDFGGRALLRICPSAGRYPESRWCDSNDLRTR